MCLLNFFGDFIHFSRNKLNERIEDNKTTNINRRSIIQNVSLFFHFFSPGGSTSD